MLLDVSAKRLSLKYLDLYELDIALPYPVIDNKGGAKYDKPTKTLTVTIPVQQGTIQY